MSENSLTPHPEFSLLEEDHIVVGGYYTLPNNKVALLIRANSLKRIAGYYFDDGEYSRQATYEEIKSWKLRKDLNDFPNAKDPKLPYVFDLLWDIKYESELRHLLIEGRSDYKKIIRTIKETGLEEKFL